MLTELLTVFKSVALAKNPHSTTKKPKGLKAKGIAFEKKVAKALPEFTHGQWLRFQDINGIGYAQPDLYLETKNFVLVVEVKLKESSRGYLQMFQLYKPLLEKLLNKPVYCLQVVWMYALKDTKHYTIKQMLKKPILDNCVCRLEV